jgi:chemotaxis protein CheY-P-specific phosphatase CheC
MHNIKLTEGQKLQVMQGLDTILSACGHPTMTKLLNMMAERIPDSNIMRDAVNEITSEITGSLVDSMSEFKAGVDKYLKDPEVIKRVQDKYKVKPVVEKDVLEVPIVVEGDDGSVDT